MKNLPLFFGVLIGTLVLVGIVAVIFTKQATAPADTTKIYGDARNATGSAQPKVTIAEFSDLQCPSCRAAEPLVQQILSTDGNQVRFVYRQYPLVTIHKNSLLAAEAAEVAGHAGKFWPFHDMMFANQNDWADLSAADAEKKMVEYGVAVGVPQEVMQKGIDAKTFDANVTSDIADGDALGVNATPTFYVNGKVTDINALQDTVANLLKQ
jgi:protein-disulfide isomerase